MMGRYRVDTFGQVTVFRNFPLLYIVRRSRFSIILGVLRDIFRRIVPRRQISLMLVQSVLVSEKNESLLIKWPFEGTKIIVTLTLEISEKA